MHRSAAIAVLVCLIAAVGAHAGSPDDRLVLSAPNTLGNNGLVRITSALIDDTGTMQLGLSGRFFSATDFVVPAIEIVDFRVSRAPGMNIIDTVADLAACGAAVLGANPRRLDAIDIRRVKGEIVRNGVVDQAGEASAVLGNPVTAVAWLANKLGQFGVSFQPGDVILTGSFVRAIPVKAGDEILCRFDQGLGDVATSFV